MDNAVPLEDIVVCPHTPENLVLYLPNKVKMQHSTVMGTSDLVWTPMGRWQSREPVPLTGPKGVHSLPQDPTMPALWLSTCYCHGHGTSEATPVINPQKFIIAKVLYSDLKQDHSSFENEMLNTHSKGIKHLLWQQFQFAWIVIIGAMRTRIQDNASSIDLIKKLGSLKMTKADRVDKL
ncbi:hypothetical protein M427DRAFT_42448 [Gonapodya prolifera JEL478]|uniref:Uncharacterized protein n=1 Tax=Gonapodya prolifera (strain JEL478) TaxID=1344416 RepID=A0A139ANN7_GONPJ|nr:hypothetical protein M427DRAFT_42448 [Gonapodya prolifera JEL478]|eukprot:KXS18359.1 hypothetical protein M427DRAFT_42448 [Gonapodya prolifera JEL478]